jgi:hypothetical protein
MDCGPRCARQPRYKSGRAYSRIARDSAAQLAEKASHDTTYSPSSHLSRIVLQLRTRPPRR